MKYLLMAVSILVFQHTQVLAKEDVKSPAQEPKIESKYQRVQTLSLTVRGDVDTHTEASKLYDKFFKSVDSVAKKHGIKDLILESDNFSVNTNTYQPKRKISYNGYLNYRYEGEKQLLVLVDELTEEGFEVRFGSRGREQRQFNSKCNCRK